MGAAHRYDEATIQTWEFLDVCVSFYLAPSKCFCFGSISARSYEIFRTTNDKYFTFGSSSHEHTRINPEHHLWRRQNTN